MKIGEIIKNKDKETYKKLMRIANEESKESTVINKIEKLVDELRYKRAYIEIQFENKKLILEKDRREKIGFDSNTK